MKFLLFKLYNFPATFKNHLLRLFLKITFGDSVTLNNTYFGNGFKINIIANNFKMIFGKNVSFKNFCSIAIREGGQLHIGNNVTFNNSVYINCLGRIAIGDDCIFGEGIKLYDHNHNYKMSDTPFNKQGWSVGYIEIGNNCWIASNVIILKNVKIGSNVVIGAGCIIHKDIPSNSLVKANSNLQTTSIT